MEALSRLHKRTLETLRGVSDGLRLTLVGGLALAAEVLPCRGMAQRPLPELQALGPLGAGRPQVHQGLVAPGLAPRALVPGHLLRM